jgi:hypothetical protein
MNIVAMIAEASLRSWCAARRHRSPAPNAERSTSSRSYPHSRLTRTDAPLNRKWVAAAGQACAACPMSAGEIDILRRPLIATQLLKTIDTGAALLLN